LPGNPYFQQDLIETRRRLGIPELGFDEALNELRKENLASERPDIAKLQRDARRLRLPLEEVLSGRREQYLRAGIDLDQEIQECGWGALGIWWTDPWVVWWLARERQEAGLQPLSTNLPAGSPPDPRIPSQRAALWLARRYGLADDYAFRVGSMILGCLPGGGESDVEIQHRRDGAGLRVTLPCVRYDYTLAQWQRIFFDSVQPQLFRVAGKLSPDVPYDEAIKQARRRAKPGRPPYTPETLEIHWRMWGFCHQDSWLNKGVGRAAFEAFLSSLPDEDEQKQEFESLDLETFRRSVKGIDDLMRPTGSEDDFWS
jgi:hypothetical protein